MSVVIPFTPRPRAAMSAGAQVPDGEVAQILFFTGVRYERQAEPAPGSAPATRRRRSASARRASVGQPA
jgi:hypothetical protein